MRQAALLLTAFLLACDANLLAPNDALRDPPAPATAMSAPLAVISIPPQPVDLYVGERDAEPVWVNGQLRPREETGPAQMDGAILVVSAVDTPLPQTASRSPYILLQFTAVPGDAGVVRLEGTARILGTDGKASTFPFTGTATPMATNADCLIWDIVGGNVHEAISFETDVIVRFG